MTERFQSLKYAPRPFICRCQVGGVITRVLHPKGYQYETDICKYSKCPNVRKQDRCFITGYHWTMARRDRQLMPDETRIFEIEQKPEMYCYVQVFNLRETKQGE